MRRRVRAACWLVACLLPLGGIAACGVPGEGPLPTPVPTSTAHELVIPVAVHGQRISPLDKTYRVVAGTTIDLRLTSDHDDVISVDPGPQFRVGAGQTVPGSFTAGQAGTYRIRSTSPAALIATLTVS